MITNALNRKLVPGNVIVINTVKHCGMVFEGIYVVLGTDVSGGEFSIYLGAYQGACRLSQLDGVFLDEKCYPNGSMVLKLAENAAALI